jgi:hypothetical protein
VADCCNDDALAAPAVGVLAKEGDLLLFHGFLNWFVGDPYGEWVPLREYSAGLDSFGVNCGI